MTAQDTEVIAGRRVEELAYGENKRESNPAYYGVGSPHPLAPERFTRLTGTPPSFVGFTDVFSRLLPTVVRIDRAFRLNMGYHQTQTVPHIAVGVKHGNACGAGVAHHSGREAIEKMVGGDLIALHGGVVMLTFPVGEEEVEVLLTHGLPTGRRLLDGIAASAFTEGARERLRRKGDKCRLLVNPNLDNQQFELQPDTAPTRRQVFGGGWVSQGPDEFVFSWAHPQLARPSGEIVMDWQREDILLPGPSGRPATPTPSPS
jgi:AICAR transformylase/IMP cyclohydrolase PurH